MISLPEFLRRFRRVWAPPGPALSRIAPPTDVAARLEAEVRPLLDAIAELQRSAESVRKDADAEAAQIVDEATQRAEKNVREAESSAPGTRAAAAKRRHEAVDTEIGRVLSESEEEANRIRATAKARMAELVEQVRACVLSGAGIGG
jgi:vacuolar-type H+-ATPase subunit H